MSETAAAPPNLASARDQVRQCRDAPASDAKEGFQSALRCVVQARNRLLQAGEAGGDPNRLRQLNAVLSLMASIEFPLAGVHRQRMDQVADALGKLA